MTKHPEKFTARDGQGFETESEALAWESVLDAKDEYDRAGAVWLSKLAATVKTADGSLFKRDRWEFYNVSHPHRQMPYLETILSTLPRLEIDDGEVYVYWRGRDDRRFRISELYQDKKAAARAVLVATDEYLGWCKADRDKLAAEIGEGP